MAYFKIFGLIILSNIGIVQTGNHEFCIFFSLIFPRSKTAGAHCMFVWLAVEDIVDCFAW